MHPISHPTLPSPAPAAVWEVVAGGQELYPGLTAMQVILQVSQHQQRPEPPADCLPALRDLMQRCWSHDAAQRCARAAAGTGWLVEYGLVPPTPRSV